MNALMNVVSPSPGPSLSYGWGGSSSSVVKEEGGAGGSAGARGGSFAAGNGGGVRAEGGISAAGGSQLSVSGSDGTWDAAAAAPAASRGRAGLEELMAYEAALRKVGRVGGCGETMSGWCLRRCNPPPPFLSRSSQETSRRKAVERRVQELEARLQVPVTCGT
jgi:hypothetical protein